ncbi:alpha/beta hydrolase [Paraburkholderia nemoris]|uniref:alpha/beta hydrolase n=1 Tax=Paraburkholderia nemoris TaxID=2793076 RepID=UPI0038BB820D
MTSTIETARIRRGFCEIAEGQVHFRTANPDSKGTPLVMLHASPGSAKMLEPYIGLFGQARRVIALDTLGNGDSAAPASLEGAQPERPHISYFAEAHVRALDALGIEQFDLYGSHTGANIACEIARHRPDRVRRLVLDGISLYTPEERDDMLEHYAPGVEIDLNGSQFPWIWTFVRDVYLFWPWYRRSAKNVRTVGLPDPNELHDKVVEVLKSARTYHIPYQAAIAYEKETVLGAISVPMLIACAKTDMFIEYFDRVCALAPQAQSLITPGTGSPEALKKTVDLFSAFLDG